jgi:hypothetical protein
MLNRRDFTAAPAAGTITTVLFPPARADHSALRARHVVLLHGLFADGSCWSELIPGLEAAGLNVSAVQNPLTTLDAVLEPGQRVLARQIGPTVLVGHSVFRCDRQRSDFMELVKRRNLCISLGCSRPLFCGKHDRRAATERVPSHLMLRLVCCQRHPPCLVVGAPPAHSV